jgi:hypothetical protein
MCHRIGLLCPQSPTAMIRMLATSRGLRTVLLALGSSESPLFIETLRLLRGNSYLWRVRVAIYERPTTDCICRIRQVIEAPTSRWTFEAGMREAAQEVLAILRHEAYERMAHSQYRHFMSELKEQKLWCYLLEIMTSWDASLIK